MGRRVRPRAIRRRVIRPRRRAPLRPVFRPLPPGRLPRRRVWRGCGCLPCCALPAALLAILPAAGLLVWGPLRQHLGSAPGDRDPLS